MPKMQDAIFGRRATYSVHLAIVPEAADIAEMQEHFLTAMDGGNAENAGCNFRPARHLLGYLAIVPEAADIAEMQEHFPASHGGPDAEKQNAIFGRRAT